MIIVKIWEGLGNQLFQYAFARALQLRTGQKVFIDTDNADRGRKDKYTKRYYELDHFRIALPSCKKQPSKGLCLLYNTEFCQKLAKTDKIFKTLGMKYYEENTVVYKKELEFVEGNVYFKGWFQNEKYFSEYAKIIRRDFIPKEKIQISLELRQILEQMETVSIHIRRGDYKRNRSMLPLTYYEQAINLINHQLDSPYFIIFSDEPEWVRENLKLNRKHKIICKYDGFKDYEEMLIMSKCRHNIIANSTFSWWAAWLNQNKDKIVMGPQTWFPETARNRGINIMPDTWMKLKVSHL